ncbi:MAG: prepilin-type N-terminal cleavage/methylation domain-containing protein [Bdellovibrionaceae bacterium]|nr:prepilin-type N-terminal cleavage/methylation domain-containing protein [Pseudobdellovibrionaceae bacterium]
MKAVRTLKNQAGFSLVELMIVVAIIGILATVAIPNFTRFQAKARQSNGKALLSGYYTSQKAAYAEYSYYPGNFAGAGFKPEANVPYRVVAADNSAVVDGGAATGNISDLAACNHTAATAANCGYPAALTENASYAEAAGTLPAPAAAALGAPGAVGTFLATAGGRIGGTAIDRWTIDQNKTLTNTVNGLP